MGAHPLQDRLRARLAPQRGVRALVAVSGGVDSLALLHALVALRDLLPLDLHAATLDHGLRGEQGADDARYVEALAAAWNVPCVRGAVETAKRAAEWGIGIEAAARRARYTFLAQTARAVGAQHVITAHHAGDQAETVLMRLVRGTGIEGLGGMRSVSPLPYAPEIALLRPLLDTPKADLTAYCSAFGILPREDVTNANTDYTRNRVRHELLPTLRGLNPQIERALTQLADLARHEHDFLETALNPVWETAQRQMGRISVLHTVFWDLPTALQRRLVVRAARDLLPDADIDYERVLAAVRLATRHHMGASSVGAYELLGGGRRFRIDYERFVIEQTDAPPAFDFPLLPHAAGDLPLTAAVPLADGWTLFSAPTPPLHSAHPAIPLHLPAGANVRLRGRHAGDRLYPPRLNGKALHLSRWMIDAKIPAAARGRVPLLTDDDGILAVLWLRAPQIDRRAAISAKQQAALWLWAARQENASDW